MAVIELFKECEIDSNWDFTEMIGKLAGRNAFKVGTNFKNISIRVIPAFEEFHFELVFMKNRLENIIKWRKEFDVWRESNKDFNVNKKKLVSIPIIDATSEETWRKKFSLKAEEFREIILTLIDRGVLKPEEYDSVAKEKYPNKVVID